MPKRCWTHWSDSFRLDRDLDGKSLESWHCPSIALRHPPGGPVVSFGKCEAAAGAKEKDE